MAFNRTMKQNCEESQMLSFVNMNRRKRNWLLFRLDGDMYSKTEVRTT